MNKELLLEAEKEVSRLSKSMKQLEEQLKRLEDERRNFDAILKHALDDRQKAIDREQKAVQERVDAETERDRAVESEKEWIRRYSEALTIAEETKSSLEKEIHEKEDIKIERDHAVNRSHVACHSPKRAWNGVRHSTLSIINFLASGKPCKRIRSVLLKPDCSPSGRVSLFSVNRPVRLRRSSASKLN